MKKNSILIVIFAICFHFLANSQTKFNIIAPMNPVALQFTVFDYGLKGAVKQVDKMFFDPQGRITKKEEDGIQTYTYKPMAIELKKYGFTYIYKLNAKKKVVSWSIIGEQDFGDFKYDANGNLVEETSLSNGFKSKITYKYDAQNRLVESTEWSDAIPYITSYSYAGTPENLAVTKIIGTDATSETVYYFKNGLLDNYKQMGNLQRKDVKYDKQGNWMSFYNPIEGVNVQRFVAYY